jgi:hypothetical protein
MPLQSSSVLQARQSSAGRPKGQRGISPTLRQVPASQTCPDGQLSFVLQTAHSPLTQKNRRYGFPAQSRSVTQAGISSSLLEQRGVASDRRQVRPLEQGSVSEQAAPTQDFAPAYGSQIKGRSHSVSSLQRSPAPTANVVVGKNKINPKKKIKKSFEIFLSIFIY